MSDPASRDFVCGEDGFLLHQDHGGYRPVCPAYPGCGCIMQVTTAPGVMRARTSYQVDDILYSDVEWAQFQRDRRQAELLEQINDKLGRLIQLLEGSSK